jgi:hypothetical protein
MDEGHEGTTDVDSAELHTEFVEFVKYLNSQQPLFDGTGRFDL